MPFKAIFLTQLNKAMILAYLFFYYYIYIRSYSRVTLIGVLYIVDYQIVQ